MRACHFFVELSHFILLCFIELLVNAFSPAFFCFPRTYIGTLLAAACFHFSTTGMPTLSFSPLYIRRRDGAAISYSRRFITYYHRLYSDVGRRAMGLADASFTPIARISIR